MNHRIVRPVRHSHRSEVKRLLDVMSVHSRILAEEGAQSIRQAPTDNRRHPSRESAHALGFCRGRSNDVPSSRPDFVGLKAVASLVPLACCQWLADRDV